MRRATFWRGVAAALILSAVGAVCFAALAPVFGSGTTLRGVLTGLALAYLVLLLRDSGARVGRLVTIAAWCGITAALWLFDPTLSLWLFAQVGLLWLVRCLYLHDSFGAALADALVSGIALAGAVATAVHTNSVFLSLWCFFLVQAVFVFIPQRAAGSAAAEPAADGFEQAYRTAEAALRRLSIPS